MNYPMQDPNMRQNLPFTPLSSPYVQPPVYIAPDPRCTAELIHLQSENALLRDKVHRKALREEAFRELFVDHKENTLVTFTPNGRAVQLAQFTFEDVKKFIYDPFYGRTPQIWVKLSSQKEPGFIEMQDFLDDKKWILFLEEVSHTHIKLYSTLKRTAMLLRSAATTHLQDFYIPFWGGWLKADGTFLYYTFSGFRTCVKGNPPELLNPPYTTLPANAKATAERFFQRFEPIQEKPLRTFLTIWVHAAVLQTLLRERDLRVKKLPIVLAENPTVQTYLRRVLSASEYGMLNMNGRPDEFALDLAACKDQTCVILPPIYSKNARENGNFLSEALATGIISLNGKGTPKQCPLGCLPILLTDSVFDLLSSPYGIPITAETRNFDVSWCAVVAAEETCLMEYWPAFLAFAHLHLEEFNDLLKQSKARALALSSESGYTADHVTVLAVMLGVAEFIQEFARELSLEGNQFVDDGWLAYAITVLEESADQSAAPDGLAEIFIDAVREAIYRHEITCYRLGQNFPILPRGVIYFDDDYLCLDRDAFDRVCTSAGCDIRAVKRDLSQHSYFIGKPVNTQTYETRISVACGGERQIIRTYKFKRETFERFGEPALFKKGE